MGKIGPGRWEYSMVVCAWQAGPQTGRWAVRPWPSEYGGAVEAEDEFGEVAGFRSHMAF